MKKQIMFFLRAIFVGVVFAGCSANDLDMIAARQGGGCGSVHQSASNISQSSNWEFAILRADIYSYPSGGYGRPSPYYGGSRPMPCPPPSYGGSAYGPAGPRAIFRDGRWISEGAVPYYRRPQPMPCPPPAPRHHPSSGGSVRLYNENINNNTVRVYR